MIANIVPNVNMEIQLQKGIWIYGAMLKFADMTHQTSTSVQLNTEGFVDFLNVIME